MCIGERTVAVASMTSRIRTVHGVPQAPRTPVPFQEMAGRRLYVEALSFSPTNHKEIGEEPKSWGSSSISVQVSTQSG